MCTIGSSCFLASKVPCTNIGSIPGIVIPLQIHCKKGVSAKTNNTDIRSHTQLYIKKVENKQKCLLQIQTCFSDYILIFCVHSGVIILTNETYRHRADRPNKHELEKCEYIQTKRFTSLQLLLLDS